MRQGFPLIVGPGLARHQISSLLLQARHSISIVDPKLRDPAMLALLDAKRAAGVKVTVLGREVTADGLLPHGKMILVDGAVAVIGSLSLSAKSLDSRRELAVIVRDRRSVTRLTEWFRTASRRRQSGVLTHADHDRPIPVLAGRCTV
jgi:phosphatidylserine/phosphatidylglycerophosphate/cardiolipin synthase-like enzyme